MKSGHQIIITIMLIFGLLHFLVLGMHKDQLNKIIEQFDYSNTERDDSWDWLVQAFEQVEMCTAPIRVSCKTRGLLEVGEPGEGDEGYVEE